MFFIDVYIYITQAWSSNDSIERFFLASDAISETLTDFLSALFGFYFFFCWNQNKIKLKIITYNKAAENNEVETKFYIKVKLLIYFSSFRLGQTENSEHSFAIQMYLYIFGFKTDESKKNETNSHLVLGVEAENESREIVYYRQLQCSLKNNHATLNDMLIEWIKMRNKNKAFHKIIHIIYNIDL